jgi:hypothetical protein
VASKNREFMERKAPRQRVHQRQTLRCKLPIDFPKPNIYSDSKDKDELERHVVFDRDMDPQLKKDTIAFIKEFWDVFREYGVKIPVQG